MERASSTTLSTLSLLTRCFFLWLPTIALLALCSMSLVRCSVPGIRLQPCICLTSSVIGFVFFVASLQAGNYKFQFTNFAWTHMALYLIVVQAHFVMNNIFEGMIWFFLPAALVITNDIFAYICGIMFGRTQLIKLSPKKTVEGFVGAWIMTVLFSFLLVNILMRSKYFICPVNVSSIRRTSCRFRYYTKHYPTCRISAPTSSADSNAMSIPSSCHTPTSSHNSSSYLQTPASP